MFDLTVNAGDFAGLADEIRRLTDFHLDLAPLGDLIAQQLIAENRLARHTAEDRFGGILPDVTETTRDRRRRDGGDPSAPPFLPHGDGSRVVANFFVRVLPAGEQAIRVESGWTGVPWLAFHAEGAAHLPVRDILGMSPEMDQWISDVFSEYVRLRVAEHLAGQPPSTASVLDLPALPAPAK